MRPVLALLLILPAPALAGAGPFHVERQASEAACGPATLATLLGWAGVPFTAPDLAVRMLDLVRAEDRQRLQAEGASIRELIAATPVLAPGFRLAAKKVTPAELRSMAMAEPVILYLLENGSQGRARAHYTIIAGFDAARGYLRADTIDGRFAWHKAAALETAALAFDDGARMLIMRLDGQRGAPPLPPANLAAAYPDIARSRLLAGLVGGNQPMLTLRVGNHSNRIALDDLAYLGREQRITLTLSTPLGERTTAIIAGDILRSQTALLAESELLPLERGVQLGAISAAVSHRISRAGASLSINLDASAQIDPRRGLEMLGLGAGASHALAGRLVAGGQIGVQVPTAGNGSTLLSPLLQLIRPIGRNVVAAIDVSATVPLGPGPGSAWANVSIERQIGSRLVAGITAGHALAGPLRGSSISFSLGWRLGSGRAGRDWRKAARQHQGRVPVAD